MICFQSCPIGRLGNNLLRCAEGIRYIFGKPYVRVSVYGHVYGSFLSEVTLPHTESLSGIPSTFQVSSEPRWNLGENLGNDSRLPNHDSRLGFWSCLFSNGRCGLLSTPGPTGSYVVWHAEKAAATIFATTQAGAVRNFTPILVSQGKCPADSERVKFRPTANKERCLVCYFAFSPFLESTAWQGRADHGVPVSSQLPWVPSRREVHGCVTASGPAYTTLETLWNICR